MKKKISLITLVCIIASAFIAILALFNALKLRGAVLDLLFTLLTLSVAGILTLNSCTMVEKKNKLAIASLGLIGASAILVIVSLWTSLSSKGIYAEITLTACILSVCFNLITANVLKLHKKYLFIQTTIYLCFAAFSGLLISASWGPNIFDKATKTFILFLILSLLGIGILAVITKRQAACETPTSDYIKISKEEYAELLATKEKYEKLKEQNHD